MVSGMTFHTVGFFGERGSFSLAHFLFPESRRMSILNNYNMFSRAHPAAYERCLFLCEQMHFMDLFCSEKEELPLCSSPPESAVALWDECSLPIRKNIYFMLSLGMTYIKLV